MSVQDIADIALDPPRAPGGPNPRTRGRKAHKHSHAGETCLNCGAQLLGEHCHVCGQPAHVHRSLAHAGEEFLHGILHLDGRTWRTLPKLFFRPGTLTRQYIDGKRADHVPPLALFLFMVFLTFVVFSFAVGEDVVTVNNPPASAASLEDQRQALADAREGLRDAQADLAQARAEGAPPAVMGVVEAALAGAQAQVKAREADLARQEVAGAAGAAAPAPAPERVSLASVIRQANANGDITINTADAKLNEKLKHKLENPELFIYNLQNTAYKYAFLFVPLTLPFIWMLFFWKRGVTLYDHVVFSLYSISAVTILILGVVLLNAANPSWSEGVGPAVMLAVPLHLFFQLKGGYRLGWFSALWRTLVLLVALSIVIALFIAAIVLLGALG